MDLVCGSRVDRISNLPADVIQRILVLLPIKDAGKTATLSTKWRRHWRSIPQLVFDGGFTVQQGESESTEIMANKLMSDINNALLLHDGPITKFVLAFPGLQPCDEIDQIILYLSDRGLQKFTLTFSTSDKQLYQVHSALFSCPHLDYLNLSCCEFRQPSWFVGFSKLTVLDLKEVTLPADFFENFLRKCPMLEILVVFHCDNPSDVAPCLQKFVFITRCFHKISFKHTPLLNTVVISLADNGLVVSEKPVVDIAVFVCSCCRLVRNAIHSLFPSDTIQPNQPANDDAVAAASTGSLLEAEYRQGSSHCCLQQLRVFKVEECLAKQDELDLLKFVLATAPRLERIHIPPSPKLCFEKFSEFTKEVMSYKRVSKEAQVIYESK